MKSLAACILAALVSACADGLPPIRLQLGEGTLPPAPHFQGLLAADEPEAVLAASQILQGRGNAADAATVLGLALAVTLPSRAGLGGGGICLVRDAKTRHVEAVDFRDIGGYARGFAALHARYGALPWGQVVAPAENMARFGVVVSRALSMDIAADGAALIADRGAFTVFTTAQRQLLREGDRLLQPVLADAFARLRVGGAGGSGPVPVWRAPSRRSERGVEVIAFDGEGAEGAGTSFVVGDPAGGVVACGVSIGAVFGTGILIDGALTATSMPATKAAIVINAETAEPRAALATAGASARFARSLTGAIPLRANLRVDGVGAGRVNGWNCAQDIKLNGAMCTAVADPAGAGYALALVPPPG